MHNHQEDNSKIQQKIYTGIRMHTIKNLLPQKKVAVKGQNGEKVMRHIENKQQIVNQILSIITLKVNDLQMPLMNVGHKIINKLLANEIQQCIK